MLIRSGKCSCECQSSNSDLRAGAMSHHMATAAVPKSGMDPSSRIAAEARQFATDLFGQGLSNLTNELLYNWLDLLPHSIALRSPKFIDLHCRSEAPDGFCLLRL